MFDSKTSIKFWRASNAAKHSQVFYFDESSNDVISLFNRKYHKVDYDGPRNGSGMFIKFGLVKNYQNRLQHVIFEILFSVLQFNGVLVEYSSIFKLMAAAIQSRENIIMQISGSDASSEYSLLPNVKCHKLLWINNLEYKKSPLFFTETFTIQLWLAFFGFFIGIFVAIWIAQRMVKTSKFAYFDLLSLFLSQGMNSSRAVHSLSIKLSLTCFGFLLVLFYSAYGAFIDSLLAIKSIDLPFRDLSELYQNPNYLMCVEYNTDPIDTIQYLKKNDKSNVVQLNTNDCPAARHGVDIWFDKQYECDEKKIVFLSGLHASNFKQILPKCNLSPLPTRYFEKYSAISVSKSFEYREEFNFLLVKMYSSGVSYYVSEILLNKIQNRLNQMPGFTKIVHTEDAIPFQQIYFILMILVVGMWLAVVVLMVEMVRFKIKN